MIAATSAVVLLGLAAELGHGFAPSDWTAAATELLSLSFEANLPTWYASALLFTCALALHRTAAREAADRRGWLALAALFVAMSIDETAQLHEHLYRIGSGEGLFHFNWVIPGAALAAVVGAAFIPFLLRRPPPVRNRFIAAGVIYLTGALAMELPLGYWAHVAGDDNLTYAIIDWFEESLELYGISVFLIAVTDQWERP